MEPQEATTGGEHLAQSGWLTGIREDPGVGEW